MRHSINVKNILLCCLSLLIVTSALMAQDLTEKDLPAPVAAGFKAKYADATETKWKKTKSGKYEADFKLSGKKAEAKFLSDGKWDSSERRLAANELPASITAYLKKNFAAYTVGQIEWKEESDTSKNRYEVKLKQGKTDTELVFDANGKFLKKKDKEKKSTGS